MRRCEWATIDLVARYHNDETGVPVYDRRHWFEFLILKGRDRTWNRFNHVGSSVHAGVFITCITITIPETLIE